MLTVNFNIMLEGEKGGRKEGRKRGGRKEKGERQRRNDEKEEIINDKCPQHRPTHQCHHLGVDERDRLTQVHGEGGVHQPTLLIESNNWGCEGRR